MALTMSWVVMLLCCSVVMLLCCREETAIGGCWEKGNHGDDPAFLRWESDTERRAHIHIYTHIYIHTGAYTITEKHTNTYTH